MPSPKVRQRWQCPKCMAVQTAPVPAVEMYCGNHDKDLRSERPAMKLIEGKPAVTKKRLVNGMLETVDPK